MTASEQIDKFIASYTDWRGQTLAAVRRAILAADPEIVEEWKWRGAPVWEHTGILCVGGAFKEKVKLTFYDGANLDDPDHLFNNGLEGGKWRTIDYLDGDKVRAKELTNLVRSAVASNFTNAQGKAAEKANKKLLAKAKTKAKTATKAKTKVAAKKSAK